MKVRIAYFLFIGFLFQGVSSVSAGGKADEFVESLRTLVRNSPTLLNPVEMGRLEKLDGDEKKALYKKIGHFTLPERVDLDSEVRRKIEAILGEHSQNFWFCEMSGPNFSENRENILKQKYLSDAEKGNPIALAVILSLALNGLRSTDIRPNG